MPAADLPINEQERLQNLYSYQLLDTLSEKDYNDITKLASYICDTPVSLVTLLDKDRQWFKSAHGIEFQQTPRDFAFCAHAILQPEEIMIVPNAEQDERFADNPLVTGDNHIMFYAGVPLLTDEGFPIGSLCVIDNKPKTLTESQQQALKTLANQTMRLIQLHKKANELSHSRRLLAEINTELENFAQVAAEHLQVPCNNAIEFTDIVMEKFDDVIDADGKQLLSLIKYSCESIKNTVDATLQKTERIGLLQDSKSLFSFSNLMQELKQRLSFISTNIELQQQSDNGSIYYYKNLLLQMVDCIISASSRFNNHQEHQIQIVFNQNKDHYIFIITDNGKGIPVFSRNGKYVLLESAGNNEDESYTTNLNKAKQLVSALSGSLEINFEQDKGTRFLISVPK